MSRTQGWREIHNVELEVCGKGKQWVIIRMDVMFEVGYSPDGIGNSGRAP